jgi:hypothetical protein
MMSFAAILLILANVLLQRQPHLSGGGGWARRGRTGLLAAAGRLRPAAVAARQRLQRDAAARAEARTHDVAGRVYLVHGLDGAHVTLTLPRETLATAPALLRWRLQGQSGASRTPRVFSGAGLPKGFEPAVYRPVLCLVVAVAVAGLDRCSLLVVRPG